MPWSACDYVLWFFSSLCTLQVNSVGALSTRLSSDAALIHETTGIALGLRVQNAVALITAAIIAFYSSWELSLVVLGVTPAMMLVGVASMKFLAGAVHLLGCAVP